MNKILLRLMSVGILFVTCFTFAGASTPPTQLANDIPINAIQIFDEKTEITPYADVIVYKFRLYYGVQQYRRWNETRGYWVDPYWIDVPGQ